MGVSFDKIDGVIWYDGRLVPWADANVHVLTHTLHYGLGAFEGLRCYKCDDGRSAIFRLREHMVRLWQSTKILKMSSPYSVDGPSAMISPASTVSPTFTSGRWLIQVFWFDRWNFISV